MKRKHFLNEYTELECTIGQGDERKYFFKFLFNINVWNVSFTVLLYFKIIINIRSYT